MGSWGRKGELAGVWSMGFSFHGGDGMLFLIVEV